MTAVQEAGTPLVLPGSRFPLGATPGEDGTNFAVASTVADAMTLCLFDGAGAETQIPLQDYDAGVWHGFVPGVGPGQEYGYRAAGRYDPGAGPALQPGQAAARSLRPGDQRRGHVRAGGAGLRGGRPGRAERARLRRACAAQPGRRRRLRLDRRRARSGAGTADTIIYEVHVKGFTMRHPGVPAELRGTYAGLGHEAAIAYLNDLGVTAVELLPVHQNVPESFLVAARADQLLGLQHDRVLRPAQRLFRGGAGGPARRPGRRVQGHGGRAARGGPRGAARRGLQPQRRGRPHWAPRCASAAWTTPAYYRLEPGDPSRYVDTTGCGNSLNAGDTLTLQLIMDSLRYWLTEMHVDGFRFDLAPSLARQEGGFDQMSAFFDLVAQDPVVSQAKLIAEPWDVGQMRLLRRRALPAAVAGVERQVPRCHARLLAQPPDRDRRVRHPVLPARPTSTAARAGAGPTASVNLFTVHDGFTLADLVSYNDKHNEANGESNRDGTDDNRSWNCGVEGPTTDPAILALRARQRRAMLTTLLLSFGVPMLLGGDERGRTQQGNNNAYCQDNEITWFDWSSADDELLAFTRRLIAFRKRRTRCSAAAVSSPGRRRPSSAGSPRRARR